MKAISWTLIGLWIGFTWAHVTIGDECDRLGGFFVGKKVFKCVEVKSGD